MFTFLFKACERVGFVFEKDENKESDQCNHCQKTLGFKMPMSGNRGYSAIKMMSVEAIKKMLKTPEEKKDFLDLQFKDQFPKLYTMKKQNGKANKIVDDDNCSYKPIDTAKLIEDLFESGCVNDAYVPDSFLVKHFSRKKERNEKVFIKGFIENDRFQVSFKERKLCSE